MTILFLPIDIDLSGLEFNRPVKKRELSAYNPYWESTMLTRDDIEHNNFSNYLKLLPFEQITTLTHKIQQKPVGSHLDVYQTMKFQDGEYEHILQNEPAGYRILLNGQLDRLEVFNGVEWITARIPSCPGCYILNSTLARHKVKEDNNREILYIRGFLNTEKHKELLDRSYKKYKDHAIELL